MSAARPGAERGRRLAWLAIAAYLAVLGAAAVLRVQGDFDIYYRAGRRVLDGASIYRLGESNHFLYAPVFAIAFAPFAALPLGAAQFAWFLVSAAALVALIIGAARMLFGPGRRPGAALVVLPVVLSARFIGNNIEHGQINLPTLALIVWAVILGETGGAAPAGFLLTAAILIKPYALPAALFLALERRWKPLGFAAAWGAALLFFPALVFGPREALRETAGYVRVVLSMAGRYRLMLTNQSAVAAFARALRFSHPSGQLPLYLGTAFELVLMVGISLWYVLPAGRPEGPLRPGRFPLAALFCLMPSLAPVSWKSYYAALLIPYMALVAALWVDREPGRKPSAGGTALLVLSVLLNWIPGKKANHAALYYSAHFVSSLALLAAVVIVARGRRGASEPPSGLARVALG